MSNRLKFVGALVGFLLATLVASRQLFHSSILRDPSGLSAVSGISHLWLAAFAGITACLAACLMAYFYARHEKQKWSKVEMTPTGPLLIPGAINLSKAPTPFDALRWALANPWLVEGQPDDKTPVDGAVRDIGGTPSEQRSFARRTHQLMFKKWSQARHD
jgi:hypothetical protein